MNHILLDGPLRKTTDCQLVAPLVELLQTDQGGRLGESNTDKTSFKGKAIGNIKLITDGTTTYTITGDYRLQVDDPKPNQPYKRTFMLDEDTQIDGVETKK